MTPSVIGVFRSIRLLKVINKMVQQNGVIKCFTKTWRYRFLLHFAFKPKKEVCHISELDHKNLSWTFHQGMYGTSDLITFFHSTFS